MKLAMVISQTNPELVFNAFRLANFSRKEGDEVKVFLLAEGVELDGINTPKFDVRVQAESFLQARGADPRMRDVPQAAQLARVGAVSLVHDEGPLHAGPGGGPRRDVLKNGALPMTGREQKAAR